VEADFEMVKASLYRVLDELELRWNEKSEPVDGVEAVLAGLRSKYPGVKLATLTNSGRAPSEALLRRYGLLKHFDFTFSRDEIPYMKPRPESITHALSVMGQPKEESLYVGDSIVDVRAARAAGVRVASVVSGRYSADRLRSEGADFVLGFLPEILNLSI
jgi:phosphoglycolate phosphatase